MGPLVYLVMFGWIPALLNLFSQFPARKAIVIGFIGAWLFLPKASFPLPGLPDYTKMSATCYGIVLATVIFDAARLTNFRPKWIDIPMMMWCICPFLSSMANGLGPYDGFSSSMDQTISWGAPYFLGRLYLSDLAGMRQLATGIFVSGLIYSPLCIFENFMSPQLHRIFYGFNAVEDLSQSIRYGGFRPVVFMEHGLMVGMWMMAGTLCGLWLWRTGVLKEVWGIPMSLLWPWQFFTFLMARSTGAYLYFMMGVGILLVAMIFRTALPKFMLMALIITYLSMAVTGNFSEEKGDRIVDFIANTVGPDRAQSIEFRLDNEEILGEKARQQMVFGWGGWGRARVYDAWGKDISVTDSLWIIVFGNQGAVGLTFVFTAMLLPSFCFCVLRYPARTWKHPQVAGAAVMSLILPLFMLDCVLNAMTNPVFTLACGGIAGLVVTKPKRQSKTLPGRSSGARSPQTARVPYTNFL